MKKRIIIILSLILTTIFILCACGEKNNKVTAASVPVEFTLGGVETVDTVYVEAKGRDTGNRVKFKINVAEKDKETGKLIPTEVQLQKDAYTITKVYAKNKQVVISIEESSFFVTSPGQILNFTLVEESEIGAFEWFLRNNALFLIGLVGCAVFLGITKYKKEKKLRER